MARRKSRRNPGNVFLSDEPEYEAPARAQGAMKDVDLQGTEGDVMSFNDWLALGAVAGAVYVATKATQKDLKEVPDDGRAAFDALKESASKIEIPAADPLPLSPSVNEMAINALAEQAIASATRAAAAYPAQNIQIPQYTPQAAPTHVQSGAQKKQVAEVISLLEKKRGSNYRGDITGGSKSSTLVASADTQKVSKPWFLHGSVGEIPQEVIQTGAQAVQALQTASTESSNYLQQAAVHPDQIAENTKKMSPLGLALTLYTLHWAYKLVTR